MADDLAILRNVTWQTEEDLRQDVAASIAAQSSQAAVEDQRQLKQAWSALREAEETVESLRHKIKAIEQERAGRALGVTPLTAQTTANEASSSSSSPSLVSPNGAASQSANALSPTPDLSTVRFKLNAALREVAKKEAALTSLQREVERRQQRRLEDARRAEQREASGQQPDRAQSNASGGAVDRSGSRALPSSVAAMLPPGVGVSPRPLAAPASIPLSARVKMPMGSGRTNGASSTPSASPSSSTAVGVSPSPAPPRPRSMTHLRGITMDAYSGGEVLPSLSRVQVSRADIRAKQNRYEDDSDFAAFQERQEKRRRLEAAQALLRARLQQQEQREERQRLQQSQSTTATSATTTASEVKREDGSPSSATVVKTEPGVGHPVPPPAAGATSVKVEDAQDSTSQALPTSRVSSATEVIDVDSLMEAEEDVSADLLLHLLEEERLQKEALLNDDEDDENNSGNERRARGETGRGAKPSMKEEETDDEEGLTEEAKRRKRRAAAAATGSRHTPSSTAASQLNSRHSSQLGIDDVEMGSLASVELAALPREPEVTLIPGITLQETVYNRLLDYQQEGVRWLTHLHAQRCGGILGDEMGLGKTIQIAAMINALVHSHQLRGPALIVAPMTVLRQWVAELHRWAPYVRVCVMHESGAGASGISREKLVHSVQGTPAVVLTTYTAMRLYCNLLHSAAFQYVILDEGHKISNPTAAITLAAKSFPTPHRIILSGSPIQNSLKELWCLFDFVRPGLLGTMARFIEEFETPIGQSKNIRATPLALATAVECARALQAQIAPYMLRRLKRQVNMSLPQKHERVIRVPLSDQQLEQYVELLASPEVQRVLSDTIYYPQLAGRLNADGRDESGSLHVAGRQFHLMSGQHQRAGARLKSFRIMNQLRQICNHADLFAVQRGEDEENRMQLQPGLRLNRPVSSRASAAAGYRCFRSNNPVNVDGSGKLRALQEMLAEWAKHGHRALIFSQTRMMLDIIENLCEQLQYRYVRMDGTTNGHHRQELMDRFNEDDSIFLALLTTRVGGIGVNLIGADRVVIFDPDWNPITDIQARERAWRIGQTRDVCVYRLITSGTVEEAILRRQLAKTYVTDKVLKDPTLQRFFHQQDGLTENFFLGAEYDSRVPASRKHVLVAQELHAHRRRGVGETFADDPGGDQERALEEDDRAEVASLSDEETAQAEASAPPSADEQRGEGVAQVEAASRRPRPPAPVPRHDANGRVLLLDDESDGSTAVASPVKAEAEAASPPLRTARSSGSPRGGSGSGSAEHDAYRSSSSSASSPTAEREFGTLLRVTSIGEGTSAVNGDTGGGARATTAGPGSPLVLTSDRAGSGGYGPGSPKTAASPTTASSGDPETHLLQSLVNGQDVVVSGSDPIAQRLARATATQTMLRVTNRTTRTVLDQQREFSMLYAAEQKRIKEEADREEQRRYYDEDQARARATQRGKRQRE